MVTPEDSGALELVGRVEALLPHVAALAQLASFTTLVEPPLLRVLRLDFAAKADAGAEADLWFSPLTLHASSTAMTLRPDVAAVLRRRVRSWPEPAKESVRKRVLHAHRLHPEVLRLEDDVVWAHIIGDDLAIERAMQRIARTISAEPSEALQVLRWFRQARSRLPVEAAESRSGRSLLLASAMLLGRQAPAVLIGTEALPRLMPGLSIPTMPMVEVPIDLIEGRIRFLRDEGRVGAYAGSLRLPDTRPRLVEARWLVRDELRTAVVDASPGVDTRLDGDPMAVELVTLVGQRYRISSIADTRRDVDNRHEAARQGAEGTERTAPVTVFIAWSGVQSRSIAYDLSAWLADVNPEMRAVVSGDDVGPGTRWNGYLASVLEQVKLGIVVVTADNVGSAWLNFEAGALARTVERMVPILFGMSAPEVRGPLAEFQLLQWSETGALALAEAVDAVVERPLGTVRVRQAFARSWPTLLRKLARQQAVAGSSDQPNASLLSMLGPAASTEVVRLVYPRFNLNPTIAVGSRDPAEGEWPLFMKPGSRRQDLGVHEVQPVAAADIRALCKVSEALGGAGLRTQPITDEQAVVDRGNYPLVSFGLMTSNLTRLYMEQSRVRDEEPLFALGEAPDGREAIRLANGRLLRYEGDNYGLIAGVSPGGDDARHRWLVFAGLGPSGTEAAANYFNDNWRSVARSVGSRDFVMVVRTVRGRPQVTHSGADDILFRQ